MKMKCTYRLVLPGLIETGMDANIVLTDCMDKYRPKYDIELSI